MTDQKHEIFIPATKYYYSFVCDSSSYVEIEVISRTAKTVTIKDDNGEVSRKKIYHMNNVEYIKPCGTYSMNPICTAEKIVIEQNDNIDEASNELDQIEDDTLNTDEVVEQLEMCLEKRDYRQDIRQIDDGIIAIPITRGNMNDTMAIWEALKSAPTPKKGEQWRLHND